MIVQRVSDILRGIDAAMQEHKVLPLVAGILLLAAVFCADALSSPALSFLVFYLPPVLVITWYLGRWAGFGASVAALFVWYQCHTVDLSQLLAFFPPAQRPAWATDPFVLCWNTTGHLLIFLIVVWLVSSWQQQLTREKELLRFDPLTGAMNRRAFIELFTFEMYRANRYDEPMTLALFNLDCFKFVNEKYGYAAGDMLLRLIASDMQQYIRNSDVLARFGGDEFAILLPMTTQAEARKVITRVQHCLRETMYHGAWPVTVSIGVITCSALPNSLNDIVKKADALVSAAKQYGMNNACFGTYDGADLLREMVCD